MPGTVKANCGLDVEATAKALYDAMKGAGTDENTLSYILSRNNNEQLQEIASKFQTMHGKLLDDEFKSELSGNFEILCRSLIKDRKLYEAELCHKAIACLGTDETDLTDIICTKTNEEIKTLKNAYKKLYNKELTEDVQGDTSGYFRRVLVSMLGAARDEESTICNEKVKDDVERLIKAGTGIGTDESVFNEIICSRSFGHLRAVFMGFHAEKERTISEEIEKETSGDYKKSLLAIVQTIENQNGYFASRLLESMKGLGTNDEDLIRLIVSRCEVDLEEIVTEFNSKNEKNLKDWIANDTSGDYKDLLLRLV